MENLYALAVGIRDAKLLRHAGAVAAKLGYRPAARYLEESLDLDPVSECSPAARAVLEKLAPAAAAVAENAYLCLFRSLRGARGAPHPHFFTSVDSRRL